MLVKLKEGTHNRCRSSYSPRSLHANFCQLVLGRKDAQEYDFDLHIQFERPIDRLQMMLSESSR
jgi:hypothetical protein